MNLRWQNYTKHLICVSLGNTVNHSSKTLQVENVGFFVANPSVTL